ncbi:sigma-70 family RNA polymerase sigma factor [Planomonospora sp. ID91781]|uniref:sigma-70 family RNA polymerase sigma factor n=1 Tax=Planomonospora sp. ID91781 TaxID=2738135 RepID=UPI0018C42A7C|nr:sigma-70 family RNA polymerase sigma factor [Planomonospora sp. ID91781]MBG0820805.1 sigma-70 family RNA polymerase sigma factor [Planomonospora sp. ID91781]
MRRYIGFRDFVQRDQRSLVGTGLLLTGSHEQAIRLALRAYRTVGLAWPPTPWENPATHAHTALYRAFLRRPTAAGATALVRLPPRRRLIAVACLHDGRTPEEMADVLGLPVETVESELTEALDTLTKGDRRRLVNRFATQAGEASVPDLSDRSLADLRRRGRRRVLLTAAVLTLLVGFIVTLTPQGQVWTTALAAGDRGSGASAAVPQAATASSGPSAPGSASASPSAEPSAGGTAQPAVPTAWKAPRTSYVIRYAVPGECRGARPATPYAGKVLCSGWTLAMTSDRPSKDRPGLPKATCEPGGCRATLHVPDAVQDLGYGDDRSRELGPAVSRDGRRLAYLSAAELRYVAHDLPSGTKRYLSPALTPADLEHTSVAVSPDGRHFTVRLADRRLRTDFATGSTSPVPAGETTPAERSAGWLDEEYPGWTASPSGKYAAAAVSGEPGNDSLHILDAASRRVVKRMPLPPLGEPVAAEAVHWLSAREVVVELTGRTSRDILGFYRVDVRNGRMHRLAGLPADDRIAIGAAADR